MFTISNYDVQARELPLSFRFQSDFEDIFEIRGLHSRKIGKKNDPQWQAGVLVLRYCGADDVIRRLEIHFEPTPDSNFRAGAEYRLQLQAGERRQLKIAFRVLESSKPCRALAPLESSPDQLANGLEQQSQEWIANYAEVRTDSPALNRVIKRSLLDLRILMSSFDGHRFFSAGLPWYGALFGRDSILSALQTLAFEQQIAEDTIRLLAKHQGKKTDDWRDEQPGKILHELRRGELANLNEIPQTPYYGSVDSTPLFLILLGELANWTGDLSLFREMREPVEKALAWIDRDAADGCGGYLCYASKSSKGLDNHGWKDSWNAIINSDGSLATPPISLVEVQGYVYRAKRLIANLFEHSGDSERATRLRHQAEELKRHFNRDFWLADRNYYALALQKDGRPAAVISSNPGQALWSRIVDTNRAQAVVQRLTSEDMFSGWGVRTLSQKERRYNPLGYHLGTVWPHDNSLIAAGFRRYGFDAEAVRILQGIVHASQYFDHARLPEVFAGFSRARCSVPVRYPVACHPQAWAAGSVPFMISSLLGLTADAFHGRLRVIRPVLPAHVQHLELRRVKIGDSLLDLHFQRRSNGSVQTEVLRNTGSIKVQLEQQETDRPEAA